MSLEIRDIEELKTTLVLEDVSIGLDLPDTLVDLSNAEISSDYVEISSNSSTSTVLKHLHIEEPGEHDTEFAAEITNADLTRPDSAMGETKAGSPSTLEALAERFETKTAEESEMEFEAEVTKSIFDLLSGDGDGDVERHPSDTGTVLEHLGNGECEEPKIEEPAAEASISNLDLPDSLIDRNVAGSPLDTVTVLEELENGNCEEPKMEKPATEASSVDLPPPDSLIDNNVDGNPSDFAMIDSSMLCREEATYGNLLEVDTGLGSDRELMQLPLEEVAQVLPNKVQDIPENDFGNNESKPESIYNTDENEAREKEHHLDKTAVCSSLEGETECLPSSKQLPLEAGKNVIQLQCESGAPGAPNGVCTVNIVGTAHVSKASCEEVKALIRHVKPEVVFLELCSSRTNILLPRELKVPTFSSMLESYRKKEMNLFGLMYSWFLAKVGEKLEIPPGTEFRIAYEEAVKCGASVTLGDRPIQITLKRTWGMMSTWHKIKLLFGILTATFDLPSADEFQALMEKMEQSDEVTFMIQELSKTFPSLSETLVAERDLYMVASLRTVARRYSSVVAVVGRGHLSGIAKHWKEDINVEELLTIPAKNSINRKWFWGTIALGVGGIAVGAHLLRHR